MLEEKKQQLQNVEAKGRAFINLAKHAPFFLGGDEKMSCVLPCLQDALVLGSPLLLHVSKKVPFTCSINWSMGSIIEEVFSCHKELSTFQWHLPLTGMLQQLVYMSCDALHHNYRARKMHAYRWKNVCASFFIIFSTSKKILKNVGEVSVTLSNIRIKHWGTGTETLNAGKYSIAKVYCQCDWQW